MATELRQSGEVGQAIGSLERLGNEAPRVVAAALRKSMKVHQRGIVAAVPAAKTPGHSTESIKASIGVRVRTKQGFVTEAKVGINVGKKSPRQRKAELVEDYLARKAKIKPKNMANAVAHLLALGTRDRWTGWKDIRRRRGGKDFVAGKERTGNPILFRGRVQADPFVKEGVAATAGAAESVLQTELGRRITKILQGQAAEGVAE